MNIEELRALNLTATPRPWHASGSTVYVCPGFEYTEIAHPDNMLDAPLIAAMCNLAPEILALVEAAQELNDSTWGNREGVYAALAAFNTKLEGL